MANTNINPFGQTSEMPAGYPIADNLTTNSAQQALSAKQGKKIGDDLYTLKILSIGNSFSSDSLSYVPMILSRLGITVEICILCEPSCSLQSHWVNRESTTFYDNVNYYSPIAGKWTQEHNKGLAYGLAKADWEMVILQQNSGNSMDFTTYQPYLNNLIDYIATAKPNAVFAWNLTHAWAEGYSGLTSRNVTMAEMEAAVKQAADRVLAETAVSLMLPYGMAIHYAREVDTLAAIGEGGNLCYSDKVHLQEGIGCQCAAYANAIAILRWLHSKKGVMGDLLRVNSSFLSTYAIPEQHGSAVGSTDTNCLLAQRCAVMANNEY